MFQSVAPCPGKVAFELEPFPAPDLRVLEKESFKQELPVEELVALASKETENMMPEIQDETELSCESLVAEEITVPEASVEMDAAAEEVCEEISQEPESSPFDVLVTETETSEVEIEEVRNDEVVVEESEPEVSEVPEVPEAPEVPEVPEVPDSPFMKADVVAEPAFVAAEISSAPVANLGELEQPVEEPADPFASFTELAAEVSEENLPESVEDVLPQFETEQASEPTSDFFTQSAAETSQEPPSPASPNPFEALAALEETAESEAKAAATEYYQQPQATAVANPQQAPSVTNWQPPAPSAKKKGSRFGGFFRQ